MNKKIKLLCICGPTASGKTGLGINLAKEFNGEIISADSMQIYNEISISTAKPTVDEMQGIPHHLIGHISVFDDYSVAKYIEDATKCINDIHSRGKLPILVGGTGLYIDSLLFNIKFTECNNDPILRENLKNKANQFGNQYLLDYLAEFDKESANRLHVNDLNRIIRAIEIYELTGITMTEQLKQSKMIESPYDYCKVVLSFSDREILYDRINLRVDEMLQNGLVNEAKMYYDNLRGSSTSSQAIGIKEIFPYFEGKAILDECISNIKTETRRYAKRQISWFKRDKNSHFFDMIDDDAQKNIKNFVKKYW